METSIPAASTDEPPSLPYASRQGKKGLGRLTRAGLIILVQAGTFFGATSDFWQQGVRGYNDDFRGAYGRLAENIVRSGPLSRETYRALKKPNVREYWGYAAPEHLVTLAGSLAGLALLNKRLRKEDYLD